MDTTKVHIMVSGLVQGVGFRMFVQREASRRGLSGWTRNLPDGRVEIEAQGRAHLVDELVQQVHIGPARAQVTRVTVRPAEQEAQAPEGFRIR